MLVLKRKEGQWIEITPQVGRSAPDPGLQHPLPTSRSARPGVRRRARNFEIPRPERPRPDAAASALGTSSTAAGTGPSAGAGPHTPARRTGRPTPVGPCESLIGVDAGPRSQAGTVAVFRPHRTRRRAQRACSS